MEYALKLAPLVFVRPGELRGAAWREFSFGGKEPEWRIPGEHMKMGEEHVVPLSRQAVMILRELLALTGDCELLFPGLRTASRPISDNTLNAALRRLGFGDVDQALSGVTLSKRQDEFDESAVVEVERLQFVGDAHVIDAYIC